jgi:hypothetical protein
MGEWSSGMILALGGTRTAADPHRQICDIERDLLANFCLGVRQRSDSATSISHRTLLCSKTNSIKLGHAIDPGLLEMRLQFPESLETTAIPGETHLAHYESEKGLACNLGEE